MSLITATITATTEQRSLEVSLALDTSPTSSPRPRVSTIRWDSKVDHPPYSSSKNKGRKSVAYPSPYANNFRSSRSSPTPPPPPPPVKPKDTSPPSPLLTPETLGRLCAKYLYISMGPLLVPTFRSSPNLLSLPLEQYIAHLISHTHLPFSIVPCTLILVHNVRKSFLNNPKRSKHFRCVFDPHKFWAGLFITAARALCPSVPNVKNLEYWSDVTAIPMKEIEGVAKEYVMLAGRDVVFKASEVERMVERLMRMAMGGECHASLRAKLAGIFRRKSVNYSFDDSAK